MNTKQKGDDIAPAVTENVSEMDLLKAQIEALQSELKASRTPADDKPEKAEKEYTMIHMDLAPSAGGAISHGGVLYVNGGTYKVEVHSARDILEIQNRGWSHESSLQTSENMGRQKLRQHITNF